MMKLFAQFDPISGYVLNLFNTDKLNYAELPPIAERFEITEDQYDEFEEKRAQIVNGVLVDYVEPKFEKVVVDPRSNVKVSAFQAHAAIARTGLYEDIQALMDDPNTPFEVKLAWTKEQNFERLSPTVLLVAQTLGIPDEQLDDLFALAETIRS